MTEANFQSMLEDAGESRAPVIALLTDFGLRDGFIGVMKGVMLQIAPNARLIDVSHDLPPQDVAAGAFLNAWACGYFPTGTVHLCVVDPGVGTGRRMIVLEQAGHRFVAPDNGLLTPVLRMDEPRRIYAITEPRYWFDRVSNTFHGRDIFAPVAAHLAAGVDPAKMGPEIHDPVWLDQPGPTVSKNRIECRVEYIDRYGNLVTDLTQPAFREWLSNNGGSPEKIRVQFYSPVRGEVVIAGLSNSYGERGEGELLAVFDGYDRLEISVRNGDARRETGLETGSPVTVGA